MSRVPGTLSIDSLNYNNTVQTRHFICLNILKNYCKYLFVFITVTIVFVFSYVLLKYPICPLIGWLPHIKW